MAVVLTEDFEGAANGATATTSNTAFTQNITATPTFDSSQFASGTRSIRINPVSTTESLTYSGASTASKSVRFYLRLTALPAATTYIANMQASTTARAQIGINSDGTVRLRNGNTTLVATTTAAMSINTWYRLEWKCDGGTSTQTIKLFSLHSTTPLDTQSGTFNTGAIDRFQLGVVANATLDAFFDAVVLDDTVTDIGPADAGFSAPTGLAAVVVSSSRIDLSWNPVTGATGYDVDRDGGIIVTGTASTSYSDTGLTPATLYSYRVRAVQ